jgi:hypothetical protein
LIVIHYLLYQPVGDRAGERVCVRLESALGDVTLRRQLVIIDIVAFALRETVQKYGQRPGPVGDQHAISARPPMSRPRHPLFDDATAKLCV